MKKKRTRRKAPTWLIVSLITLLVTAVFGLFAFGFYQCTVGTACDSTDEEHRAAIQAKALAFAQEDCDKSYKNIACKNLKIWTANFSCGIKGFCGWIVNIESNDSNLKYTAGMSLELDASTGIHDKIAHYSELETPYADSLTQLFLKMCADYPRTKARGCNDPYFSAGIDWLGNRHDASNPDIGVSVTYMNPYTFEAKIDRTGKILEAYILNFDEDSDKILYHYKPDHN